jgi:hypothetical protein
MHMKYVAGSFLILSIALSGCGQSAEHVGSGVNPIAQAAAAAQPELVVYKNESCGCCGLWVEHMRKAGFAAKVHNVDNMSPVKERVGVPYSMGSCHTAEVGGYFIEGHVPAAEVLRLLKEKPQAKGLTVPAMPIGSPGMEQGNMQQPYEVHLVNKDGTTSVYARYPKK